VGLSIGDQTGISFGSSGINLRVAVLNGHLFNDSTDSDDSTDSME
jgi:hypothetical protein